jgi:outer membrane immunogenic protein
MLRRILLASAGAMALTGAALAADLSLPAPPPVYTWTGIYAGIDAGYTWSSNSVATSAINTQFCGAGCTGAGVASIIASALRASASGATATVPANFEGFIGGGQIGYNYQFDNSWNSWLIGLEADIQGVAGNNNGATLVNVTTLTGLPLADHSIGTTFSVSRRLDYLGTLRGRLGFLFTPTLLVYGTGGLAWGGVTSSTSINQVFNGLIPSRIESAWGTAGNFSTTRVGWTAGGGIEWLFAPNWSVKAEYLYYDLGNVSYSAGALVDGFTVPIPGEIALFTNAVQSTTRFNGNIVRAGLNYHFNWGGAPIVAKY